MDITPKLLIMICFFGSSHQVAWFSVYNTQPEDQQQFGCGTPPDNCEDTKYRSLNGSCNNLQHPAWGMIQMPFQRLLNASYEDGVDMPVLSKSGKLLTNARTISVLLYPDSDYKPDPKHTLAAMQYGQIISHDLSLSAVHWSNQLCCSFDGVVNSDPGTHPVGCMPIIFPYYENNGTSMRCIPFNRTISTLYRGCTTNNETANPISAVTSYLDLSNVYGSSDIDNKLVRSFIGGKILIKQREGYQWPSNANPSIAAFICPSQNSTTPCYIGGDNRVDQHAEHVVLQVALFREHNRIADGLAKINPHWDDETLFQEVRRILIAEHQQISYYEWLPVYLGTFLSKKNHLVYEDAGYVDDYSDDVNPAVLTEFEAAAFRYFHAAIAGQLHLASENRKIHGTFNLSDTFETPILMEEHNNYDNLIRGFTSQPQTYMKTYHTKEVTERLFKLKRPFVYDIKSLDIQRGRDHGLPTYNNMRQHIGLQKAETFKDFLDVIDENNIEKLMKLYETPDDVDLAVGGSLEKKVPGTLLGPSFLYILIEQFKRTRKGDRFWFEHSEKYNGFTKDQLAELRKVTVAKILCDNGNNVKYMQKQAFYLITQKNPLMACDDIPGLNLKLWKTTT